MKLNFNPRWINPALVWIGLSQHLSCYRLWNGSEPQQLSLGRCSSFGCLVIGSDLPFGVNIDSVISQCSCALFIFLSYRISTGIRDSGMIAINAAEFRLNFCPLKCHHLQSLIIHFMFLRRRRRGGGGGGGGDLPTPQHPEEEAVNRVSSGLFNSMWHQFSELLPSTEMLLMIDDGIGDRMRDQSSALQPHLSHLALLSSLF